MDYILKGKIPETAKVLDAGCGEGRNAIFFVQKGYDFLGIDSDESKIRLAQYMSNNISTSKAVFRTGDIHHLKENAFDLIICSRVLHFAQSEEDFFAMWRVLSRHLSKGGLIYLSMDSVIENTMGVLKENGKYEFQDGAIHFSLTEEIYNEIKKGFEEIEPLKTLVQNKVRAQSFVLLRKV